MGDELKRTYRAGTSKYVTPGILKSPVIETRQRFSDVVPIVCAVDLVQEAGDLYVKNPFVTEYDVSKLRDKSNIRILVGKHALWTGLNKEHIETMIFGESAGNHTPSSTG